jgi:chromosome segregation ATPase
MRQILNYSLTIVFTFGLLSGYCQDAAQDAISSMYAETSNMKNALAQIDGVIKKDKHKDMEKEIHNVKNSLSGLRIHVNYLPNEYRDNFTGDFKTMETTIAAFENRVHKSRLFDKDKELRADFQKLNTNLNSIIDQIEDVEKNLKPLPNPNPPNGDVRPAPPSSPEPDSHGRDKAIEKIKSKNDRADDYLEDINHAFKKNAYEDIARYSRDIKYLCKDIEDLAEDLKDGEKSEITRAIGKIEDMANDLAGSAKKGHSEHVQMHDDFEHLEKECERFRTRIMLLN